MYLPLVMFGYAGILCLILAGCWPVHRSAPRLRGVRELSCAIGAAIVSVVLVGLRPWTSAFLSILVGNGALFAYFLLIYWTTARILGVRARALPWLVGVCVTILLPFSFYTFVRPNIVMRIVLGGSVAGIIAGMTALMLFRPRSSQLAAAATAPGLVQVFSAAVYLGRSIVSTVYPPVHFVSGDWIQTSFTYAQMLARLGTCCGLLWLTVCVHRKELEELAMSDGLTGLLNRRAFDELLTREMRRSRFSGEDLALIMVDIDHFKDVNDTYGHNEGDAVIRQTGQTLMEGVRPRDTLARFGGEEFAILLRETSSEAVFAVAERLRSDIAKRVVGSRKISITASFGIAHSRPGETPRELLNRCDRALYQSKHAGRNGVSVSAI